MSITRRHFLQIAGASSLAIFLPFGCRAVSEQAEADPFAGLGYKRFSGIYPHLAFYNNGGECGVGAVVPWAGRLWVVTYSPHQPFGSDDKLYEIDEKLGLVVRPESVGGTPANRMIHRESEQLIIGPYLIDSERKVRVVSYETMPGRPTGNARHLTDPANKVYFATMEEGFYEVDVHTLEVRTINLDGNATQPPDVAGPLLPGYHGKGLYSGQGRLIYANNGERSNEALTRPDIPSGCLAEYDGENWTVVRRAQFTEVTGPGGIEGNMREDDPVWSYGWDHRSAIFMVRDGGQWHTFRMPKASHTYDGAHGWHTEWPRIREIGGDRMLMTMHGMFWDFPKTFSANNTSGIRPLSSYLKIIGDFTEWMGYVVFGCDDAALSAFSATAGSTESMVGQSNSNLWFIHADQLDDFGPLIGRGGPWINDAVKAGSYSEPFFTAGFDYRMVHIRHDAGRPVTFTFEGDRSGTGQWSPLAEVVVPESGYAFHIFEQNAAAEWIRVRPDADASRVTVVFQLAGRDNRGSEVDPMFAGLASPGKAFSSGIIRPRGENRGTLQFAATRVSADDRAEELGYYEIGPDMKLVRVEDPEQHRILKEQFSVKDPAVEADEASLIMTDASGRRYRIPRGPQSLRKVTAAGWPRPIREIVTERSIFSCEGNLYELPRDNSGGFPKIRPVASSDRLIMDLCSWRGMLVIAGIADDASENEHIVRSEDGETALWFGTIDDLWQLGKPRGEGGPWKNSPVRAGEPSDPYLMTGYDQKRLILSHAGSGPVTFTVEVDLTGDGDWAAYQDFELYAGETLTYDFPEGFNTYWVRLISSGDVEATAQFIYS